MASKAERQVICPGLFGGLGFGAGPALDAPALDRLLTRADRLETPPRDPLETLAAAFGLTADHGCAPGTAGPARDLPSAALCLLAEAPDLAREGCWFHADPVHLRPDRDRLLLFGGPSLGITDAESAALVAAFNAHFGSDGLELVATGPGRWYLRLQTVPDLLTHPLYQVSGRAVAPYLPTGPDARAWNRWQNEAQMLFYQHPVNQTREASGRPAVSGVWAWGGGVLPVVPGGPDLIIADHPFSVGLGRASGARVLGLDALARGGGARPETWPESVLIFWDRLWWPALAGDLGDWRGALAGLETLIGGLSAELAAGRARSLTLDDGERWRFALTPWGQRRFWRRGRGLRELVAAAEP